MNAAALDFSDAREAAALGMQVRIDRSLLKRGLKRGTEDIAAVLAAPPSCLRGVLLFDVALMAPYTGPERLREINEEAMLESVNLAVPVDRAARCDRVWLAERLVSVRARRGR